MLPNLIIFVFIGVISAYPKMDSGEEPYLEIPQEVPCSSVGGSCQIADTCLEGHLAPPGLCPLQQDSGIECCYGLSRKETRCSRRGGHCVSKTSRCPDELFFGNASDCGSDEKCCILVN